MIDSDIKLNFSDYINNNSVTKKKIIDKLPDNIDDLPNIILYGSSGTGKYTSSLDIIKNYSKSNLKYSKKIMITNSKTDIYIKISDIHFEIDMELLGCNARILWNDIYYNIIDIISSGENKGIILCKNFQSINSELLDIFYSYMQKEIITNYTIKYIILTDSISFIPNAILSTSKIFQKERFNKSFYKKEFSINNIQHSDIVNNLTALKIIDNNSQDFSDIMLPYKKICDHIINIIYNIDTKDKELDLSELRKVLYDILIYNLNIYDCIFYILKTLINNNKIINNELNNESLLYNTFIFLKYYNNNYRPIYHLENYILYLIKDIHGL